MQARMKNPTLLLPESMNGVKSLLQAIDQGEIPQSTKEFIGLRASQINSCGPCIHAHVLKAKQAGETDERIAAVGAWRHAPCFTEAERAVLALTEAATRLADHPGEAVPDAIWDEAAAHYDERQLAAILLTIATVNFFNRINVTLQEPVGATWN